MDRLPQDLYDEVVNKTRLETVRWTTIEEGSWEDKVRKILLTKNKKIALLQETMEEKERVIHELQHRLGSG